MTRGEITLALAPFVLMAALAPVAINGCSDDWVKYDCKNGPAYHAEDELVCWTHAGSPYASREFFPDDDPESVCAFCDGFIQP